MVSEGPVCLEVLGGVMCAQTATHEVTCGVGDGWGAKCDKCAKFYRTSRKLTPIRRNGHELAQWRMGTLLKNLEISRGYPPTPHPAIERIDPPPPCALGVPHRSTRAHVTHGSSSSLASAVDGRGRGR